VNCELGTSCKLAPAGGIEKVKIVIVDEINKPKSKEDEKYAEIIKKRPR